MSTNYYTVVERTIEVKWANKQPIPLNEKLQLWETEKNLRKPTSTQSWRGIVLRCGQIEEKKWKPNCSPFFKVTHNSKALIVQGGQRKEQTRFPKGEWEGLLITPYFGRVKSTSNVKYKKRRNHSTLTTYVRILLSIWRLTGQMTIYMEGNKKIQVSPNRRLPVAGLYSSQLLTS